MYSHQILFDPDTAYVVWIFVSLGFLYNIVMLQTFKRKWHCSAMGCYRRCIVPGAATVTSKLYCHYCFTEYMRTSAGHKATHKQSEFIAVNRIVIGWISDPIWCIFLWNITIYMTGRKSRIGEVLGVFNKCWGLWPLDTLSSWGLGWRHHACTAKTFFVESLDLSFQSTTIVALAYMFVLDKRNTLWLRNAVRQTSRGKSAAEADRRSAPAADFPRDVCLTVSLNPKVFLLYWTTLQCHPTIVVNIFIFNQYQLKRETVTECDIHILCKCPMFLTCILLLWLSGFR